MSDSEYTQQCLTLETLMQMPQIVYNVVRQEKPSLLLTVVLLLQLVLRDFIVTTIAEVHLSFIGQCCKNYEKALLEDSTKITYALKIPRHLKYSRR